MIEYILLNKFLSLYYFAIKSFITFPGQKNLHIYVLMNLCN